MVKLNAGKKFRDRVQSKRTPNRIDEMVAARVARKDLLWQQLLPAMNIFRKHGEVYMERLTGADRIRVEVFLLPFEPNQQDTVQVPAADIAALLQLGWWQEGEMYVTSDEVLLGSVLAGT